MEDFTHLSATPQVPSIVNEYLNGATIEQLAIKHSLPEKEVVQILSRKEVKRYINTQLQNYGYLNPFKRISVLNKLLENKLDESYSSEKDVTEILKLLQKEQEILNKQDIQEETQKNQYLTLVQNILNA